MDHGGFFSCGHFVSAILIVRRTGIIIRKRVTKIDSGQGSGKVRLVGVRGVREGGLRGLTGASRTDSGLRSVGSPVPECEGPGAPSFVVWKHPGIGVTCHLRYCCIAMYLAPRSSLTPPSPRSYLRSPALKAVQGPAFMSLRIGLR